MWEEYLSDAICTPNKDTEKTIANNPDKQETTAPICPISGTKNSSVDIANCRKDKYNNPKIRGKMYFIYGRKIPSKCINKIQQVFLI